MFPKVMLRVSLLAYISKYSPSFKTSISFLISPRNSKSLRSEREYVFEWTSTSQSSPQYVVVELYYYCLFNYLDFFPTKWENTIRDLYSRTQLAIWMLDQTHHNTAFLKVDLSIYLHTYILLKLTTGLSSDQTFFGNQR